MKTSVGALVLLVAWGAAHAAGLLPGPPPFAEVFTEEGTKGSSIIVRNDRRPVGAAPSSVANSGNGGGSGRRPSSTATAQPRFFFEGDGHLKLAHAHFAEKLDVRYRRADGTYDPAALAQIRHFFRSREDGREDAISLRLIELLAYVQDHFHPRQMTLLSGYRSPQFNADLRAAGQKAAQASLHTEGLAADIAFAGVDLKRLWQQMRQLQAGGAGYYRSGKFLHIDTGRPRFWEETTSRVDENLAAGNARVFLRTDFDRYPSINGAVLNLHSITVFPLRVAAEARIVTGNGSATARLVPLDGTAPQDGCIAINSLGDGAALRIVDAPSAATVAGHGNIVLTTCEPRLERTPPEIASNPIELTAR